MSINSSQWQWQLVHNGRDQPLVMSHRALIASDNTSRCWRCPFRCCFQQEAKTRSLMESCKQRANYVVFRKVCRGTINGILTLYAFMMALDSKLAVSSMKRPTSSMALPLVSRLRPSVSGWSSGKHWATPFCRTIRAWWTSPCRQRT